MKRDKLQFMFGIHGHQPVGNFDTVVEEAFRKCYAPFLKTLAQFPGLRAAVHFSGPLLEWIDQREPEFLSGLRRLLREERVEILGGGFYEPILTLIPEVDRQEQIELMAHFCDRMLGVRPRGFWLTERVWEPQLPSTLEASQIDYTFLDDHHFRRAGIDPETLGGDYLTEDQGARIRLFPLDGALRYAIPFKTPEEALTLLHEMYEQGSRQAVTVIDDAEKFGLWPGTYRTLYGENWLSRFFSLLVQAQNDEWLDVTTPMAYAKRHAPRGLVYLPSSSYPELEAWARGEEAKDAEPGPATSFKRFFMRYPEANHMHKRMLEVSHKVHLSSLDGQPREAAKRELFRAQCNCAYWHGLFGGLYYPFLRDAVYEHLLKAERLAGAPSKGVEAYDLDGDGQNELALHSPHLRGVLAPHNGGLLYELDVVAGATNLANTLARHPEPYHDRAFGATATDTRRLGLFREGLFVAEQIRSAEDLRDARLPELGHLGELAYTAEIIESATESGALLRGTTWFDERELAVTKRLALKHGAPVLQADYTWALRHGGPIKGAVAIRLDLSLPSALGLSAPFAVDGLPLPGVSLLSSGQTTLLRRLSLRDPHHGFFVHLDVGEAIHIRYAPLFTCSRSEKGLERQCQAISLWLVVPLALDAGQERGFTVCLEVEHDAGRSQAPAFS